MAKKDFDNREDIERGEEPAQASTPSGFDTKVQEKTGDRARDVKNASASGLGSLEKTDEEQFESDENQSDT